MEQLLDSIAGKTLTHIDFSGNDNIRLDFEGNVLVLYQWPVASADGVETKEDEVGYREQLTGLVKEVVQSLKFSDGVSLTINFARTKIDLSLADDEESFYFKSKDGDWMVG